MGYNGAMRKTNDAGARGAIIRFRVTPAIRDQIKVQAERKGLVLSEYMRALVGRDVGRLACSHCQGSGEVLGRACNACDGEGIR